MIDYIKINDLEIGPKIQDVLDFELKVNHRTGEELFNRKRSAYLLNLVFTVTPGERFAKMQGSLHKFSNKGDLNNDRFTFERFLKVADQLSKYISDHDRINVLEFGVNLHLSANPSDLIRNLICHLKKPFNKTIMKEKHYAQVEYKHFILKIYDKGLQQGPEGSNILRFEVKYLRMQKIFPYGLTWSQLKNPETWIYLGDILRKKFSEVIYYDPSISLKNVPEKEREFIREGRNPFYWQDLSSPHVSRIRKKYQNLINNYGNRFRNLYEILDREVKELVKSYHNSETVNMMENSVGNSQMVNSYTLLYGNISPVEKERSEKVFCEVTGIDISMQRPGSKFLCSAGIKYLYYHDRDLYEKLADERLSRKWLRYPLEIHFREIAHSIRNEFYNPKNNARHSIERMMKDPSLFDILSLISEEKKSLAGVNI